MALSKKKRDERRREMHIDRGRERRAATAQSRKKTVVKPTRKRSTIKARRTAKAAPRRTPEPMSSPEDDYSAKLSSVRSELNSLSFRTRNLSQSVNQLDNNINELSNRIQNIRNNRYLSQTHLDTMFTELDKNWSTISSNIQSYSLEQSNHLLGRQSNLEANIDRAGSLDELVRYGALLSDISRDIVTAENSVQSQLDDYQSQYQTLDRDLRIAEETVSNLVNSSIGWKNYEHPVLAVNIHDMTNDRHGVLTLTNQRILFEEISEEVIRKNLFFATEKKTTREVQLDEPIGSIMVVEKGRVGFFKGAGLYIKFKPQTRLEELKIDTSGNDDDKIISFYNYIVSGEADKELEPMQENVENNAPVRCPNCSAPYQEEILKGQTSVKCIYCGTVIKL